MQNKLLKSQKNGKEALELFRTGMVTLWLPNDKGMVTFTK